MQLLSNPVQSKLIVFKIAHSFTCRIFHIWHAKYFSSELETLFYCGRKSDKYGSQCRQKTLSSIYGERSSISYRQRITERYYRLLVF